MAREVIQINSREGFRAHLKKLQQLHDELAGYSGAKFQDALNAAASGKGGGLTATLIGSSVGQTTTSSGTAAPVYSDTVTAVSAMVTAAESHISAAKASVSVAISDLTSLLNGMTSIDDDGAGRVRAL